MNAQPSLFDYHYPGTPGFKERGGASQDAALASREHASRLRPLILRALADKDMLSTDQAAEVLAETVLSVRPRFSELKEAGLVEKTPFRVKNNSGHTATVWRLTEAGRIAAQEGRN
jgi:predicted ArsR family transcriptional regulator